MVSVVCARSAQEVSNLARFEPDYIAIEPPELIGSGKAVSKENPSIVTDSLAAVCRCLKKRSSDLWGRDY